MALIFMDGFESLSEEEIKKWKRPNKEATYPDLICVVDRELVEKYLGLIIADTPVTRLMWSAWINKDIRVGDVVMDNHGNSFFVHRIDFGDKHTIIRLET